MFASSPFHCDTFANHRNEAILLHRSSSHLKG